MPSNVTLFSVSIGGMNISRRISPYLISLQVNDKAGQVSDTASVELDDSNGQIGLPKTGTEMQISLGAYGQGMTQVFNGFVDATPWKLDRGGGRILSVDGRSAKTQSEVKQPEYKHWDKKTLGAILPEAAQIAGLTAKVHGDIAGIMREYEAMDRESFIAFGQRIAREVGATFKIIGTQAIFVPRNAGQSVSGQAMTSIRAAVGVNLISANLSPIIDRPRFKDIKGAWYDHKKAKLVEEKESTQDDVQVLERTRFNQYVSDSSKASAKSEAEESDRNKGGGTVTIDGDARCQVQATCNVSGCRSGVDGTYVIDGVDHRLDRGSGFLTTLTLKLPGGGAGTDGR